jgi:hypothetical protein
MVSVGKPPHPQPARLDSGLLPEFDPYGRT